MRLILSGDFNTYADYEDAMEFLTRDPRSIPESNRCWEIIRREQINTTEAIKEDGNTLAGKFYDLWSLVHRNDGEPGYTFSNLPFTESTHTWPSIPCRPDRILISKKATGRLKPTKGIFFSSSSKKSVCKGRWD